MSYDVGRLEFNQLDGGAALGWTLMLGESRLGVVDELRTPIRVSSLTVAGGYEVGDNRELSLDPATGTATMSDYAAGEVAQLAAPPVRVGRRCEVVYDGVVIFQGAIVAVVADVTAEPAATRQGYAYTRRVTYSLRSYVAEMLNRTAQWAALPAEPALTRLRRWFTVSTARLTAAQLAAVNTVVADAETEPGTTSYLEIARQFTAATRLPVRHQPGLPPRWDQLEVLPGPIAWDGQPPAADVVDAHEWASTLRYTSDGVATPDRMRPEAVTSVVNDTRFLGGVTTIDVPASQLGALTLGVSRLGQGSAQSVGFAAGEVVDLFGFVMAAARITHTFTARTYGVEVEVVTPAALST